MTCLKRFRKLTEREYETMLLVVMGKPTKAVAEDLGISERTVKAHRGAVMQKLGVSSLAELVALTC
jgi:FixJ family two-component response regulator